MLPICNISVIGSLPLNGIRLPIHRLDNEHVWRSVVVRDVLDASTDSEHLLWVSHRIEGTGAIGCVNTMMIISRRFDSNQSWCDAIATDWWTKQTDRDKLQSKRPRNVWRREESAERDVGGFACLYTTRVQTVTRAPTLQ